MSCVLGNCLSVTGPICIPWWTPCDGGFLFFFSSLSSLNFFDDNEINPKSRLLKNLQKIVENHDLNDKVLLVGKKPYNEIPKYLAASDVCVLPAYPDEEIMQDIVPIKIYEYMAMGKPVITTMLPGIMKEFGKENLACRTASQ